MVEHLRLASDRESLDATEPEDDGLCPRCGHAWDYHRTLDHRCTREVPRVLDACPLCGAKLRAGWLVGEADRCTGCGGWIANMAPCRCDMTPRLVVRSDGGQ